MRFITVFFAACFLLIAPLTSAQAAGVSKEEVINILSAKGYNAQIYSGDRVRVDVAEYTIIIWIDGADSDISYATWLPGVSGDEIGLKVLNEFNTETKFGRAYVDADGDVLLQMDRNSAGGVSPENVESDFDVFLSLIYKFLSDLESQRIV